MLAPAESWHHSPPTKTEQPETCLNIRLLLTGLKVGIWPLIIF